MDKTPPRNRLIALYTGIAVVTLMALKPAFDAYFDRMHVATQLERIRQGVVDASVIGNPSDDDRRAAGRALEKGATALSRCYDARLPERPGLTGVLEARVRNQSGVVSVQVDASGINDAALVDCTRSALQALQEFPPNEVQLRILYAPTEAAAAELEWNQALANAPTPISEAMARLARQGRMAHPSIRPQAQGEMNLDPLRGWVGQPLELPPQVRQRQAQQAGADEASASAEGEEETTEGEEPAEAAAQETEE